MTKSSALIEPLVPSSAILHNLRDRETTARLELEECRLERERMAVHMLREGATNRMVHELLALPYNRISEMRVIYGAPVVVKDLRASVLRHAQDTSDKAEIAMRAGVSERYVYQVLGEPAPDAIETARDLAKSIKAGLGLT